MNREYLKDISDVVLIEFAKKHTNDIKSFKITERNESDFFYAVKKVGTYKVCKVTHGKIDSRKCARFVFRDYTCNVHGPVVPTSLDLSRDWREVMIENLDNKKDYIREFNHALDNEIKELDEDYVETRKSLESLRLKEKKVNKKLEQNEEEMN